MSSISLNPRRTAPVRELGKSQAQPNSIDWWLVAIVMTLLCFGLLMVLSASGVVGERIYDDKYLFFRKQLMFAGIGAVLLIVCTVVPRDWINKMAYPSIFLAFILLLLCLSPMGTRVNGAQRWLNLGFTSIQPMEFARIALVLYLAYFLSAKQELLQTFTKGVIPPFAITLVLCLLLILQPDFGAVVIMIAILFFMCLVGGTRIVYLVLAGAVGAVGLVGMIFYSPYRMRRLLAFLDPFEDALDSGYQLVQSLYALGSGGFFGVGMGNSRQKLLYLPEAHNDFIMAVVGEELGFVGVTLIMVLFAMLFARCYRIIMGQKDQRDKLTAFGLTLILALGVILNLAVILGMAPPKGVAMPLISSGGSSLMASMICLGLLLNYSKTCRSGP